MLTRAALTRRSVLLGGAGAAAAMAAGCGASTHAAQSRPRVPTVALSWDGGWQTVHSTALPILQAHGMVATVYVTTWFVSRLATPLVPQPALTWDQVGDLADAGLGDLEPHAHAPPPERCHRHQARARGAGRQAGPGRPRVRRARVRLPVLARGPPRRGRRDREPLVRPGRAPARRFDPADPRPRPALPAAHLEHGEPHRVTADRPDTQELPGRRPRPGMARAHRRAAREEPGRAGGRAARATPPGSSSSATRAGSSSARSSSSSAATSSPDRLSARRA